jgi:hypothetical protein
MRSLLERWCAPWRWQTMRIGVAPRGVALVRTGLRSHEPRVLLGQVRVLDHAPATLGAAVASLAAEHALAGWPVAVVLDDELVRLWRVAPPPGATRMADLEGAAALRFATLFGSGIAGWTLAAEWDATRPFLAAALPRLLLDALIGAAQAQRFELVEIVPQFVAALHQHGRGHRPGAWFGLLHGDVLAVAAYDDAGLAAVRTVAVPQHADRAWLERLVAREALRLGLACPRALRIHGPAPRAWDGDTDPPTLACTLFDDCDPGWPDHARLALTGTGG